MRYKLANTVVVTELSDGTKVAKVANSAVPSAEPYNPFTTPLDDPRTIEAIDQAASVLDKQPDPANDTIVQVSNVAGSSISATFVFNDEKLITKFEPVGKIGYWSDSEQVKTPIEDNPQDSEYVSATAVAIWAAFVLGLFLIWGWFS